MRRQMMAAAAAWLTSSAALAAPILYEGFDYAENSTLSPNSGWATIGTGFGTPTIGTASLGYPGLPTSTGRSVRFDRTKSGGSRIDLPGGPYQVVGPATSLTMYYSMTVTLNDYALGASTSPDGSFFAGFNNGVGTQTLGGALDQAGQLLVRKDPNNLTTRFQLGVAKNNGVPRAWDESTSFLPGEAVFVVVGFTINNGEFNDLAQLWVNPVPGATMPAADAAAGIGADMGSDPLFYERGTRQLASLYLRNNGVQPGNMQVDELRIGLTYADVTPGSGPVDDADFDADGDVDGADFLTWQRGLGGAPTLANGNANGDAVVDGADLAVWESQFGSTVAAWAAVPEPATWGLIVVAVVGMTLSRLSAMSWGTNGKRRLR